MHHGGELQPNRSPLSTKCHFRFCPLSEIFEESVFGPLGTLETTLSIIYTRIKFGEVAEV